MGTRRPTDARSPYYSGAGVSFVVDDCEQPSTKERRTGKPDLTITESYHCTCEQSIHVM